MKERDEIVREFTRQWLDKAEDDLRACKHLISGGDAFAEAIAFHAQQATEKFLKAYLVRHQIEFSKTHDIKRLLELVWT